MTTAVTPHYTHADHARACAEAARRGTPFKQCVQVNYNGTPICGVIVDAWDCDDREMWKVRLTGEVTGIQSFPATKVRKCSGVDDKCICCDHACSLF